MMRSKPSSIAAAFVLSSGAALSVSEAATLITGSANGVTLSASTIPSAINAGDTWLINYEFTADADEDGVNLLPPNLSVGYWEFDNIGGLMSGRFGQYEFDDVPFSVFLVDNAQGFLPPGSTAPVIGQSAGRDLGIIDNFEFVPDDTSITATIPGTSDTLALDFLQVVLSADQNLFDGSNGNIISSSDILAGANGLNEGNSIFSVSFSNGSSLYRSEAGEFSNSDDPNIPEPSTLLLTLLATFAFCAHRVRGAARQKVKIVEADFGVASEETFEYS